MKLSKKVVKRISNRDVNNVIKKINDLYKVKLSN